MTRINRLQWRVYQNGWMLVDFDLTNWTFGFDLMRSFGIYLGPIVLDFHKGRG